MAGTLVRDIFSVLESSKCEVLLVLDQKDAFIPLGYQKIQRNIVEYSHIFGSTSYLYQRMHVGLNIFPSIWQSYVNMILDCLQDRKYCEAVMDGLLLFIPSKRSHMAKLEDLLKALLKNGLKISPKEMPTV